jgi:hypothetical protein
MIDLHLHSSYSDGKLSVEELVEEIIVSKVSYCSLTDHDSIDGLEEIKALTERNLINFINGVEFSVLYNQQEIHVLVYDFNIEEIASLLKERNRIVESKRIEELRTTIDLFKKEGFKISNDLKLKEKKTVGLLVALDVYGNKENHDLMIKQCGYLPNEEEFYVKYQAYGCPCYVTKSGIDLDWLLEKLKNIKCDKILAHPFVSVSFLVKPLEIKDVDYLIDRGLSGVEVYHDRNTDKQIDILKKYVAEKKLLFTGGSDFHGNVGDMAIGFYNKDKNIPEFKLTNHQS